MSKKLINIVAFAVFILLVIAIGKNWKESPTKIASPTKEERVWQIKSIDTMKYSRDPSAAKLNDLSFDAVIERHVKDISDLGATHVAIATPYDGEFVPILTRWVNVARRNRLKVWFRGNFSAWEGWFGREENLTREEHLAKTREFIKNNKDLFRDGDVFSACPECENGGAGDPRQTGDIEGFRKFMIDEYNACQEVFKNIGKNVTCNLASMNLDVAKRIMDTETAEAMGGVIAIDHYTKTPEKLESDIVDLAAKTHAKIFLGEFGAPIPDINGDLTKAEQAEWLNNALRLISARQEVIGVNYWVSVGGSTAIFDDNNIPKPAAAILAKYFKLTSLPN